MNKLDYKQKRADCLFGKKGEEASLSHLRSLFGNKNVYQYDYKYCPMDFYLQEEGEAVGDAGIHLREFEVKSRRVKFGFYPDYAFGENKIVKAKKKLEMGIPTTFIFNLTDGFYYWNFDENTKSIEYREGMICNIARNDTPHKSLFIKKPYITKMDNFNPKRNLDDNYHKKQIVVDFT
tara:strand:- start:245 stop:778 length:534 start_codon:yes stop_codon:yes gene_type:complete